jgi:PAS domain S-box-containing protein
MREGQTFDEQVEAIRQRLDLLFRSLEGRGGRRKSPPAVAWEELSAALQDVGMIGEDLRQQNEELEATCKALESELQYYHDLFDSAPDGYIVTDGLGNIHLTNRAMANFLHVRQSSVPGRSLSEFIPTEERGVFNTHLTELRDRHVDKIPYWVLQMRAHDGAPFWAAVSVVAVPGAPGEPTSLRWVLRDVTQRKWAEESLQESEERYRTIVDSTQDGLTIIEDGRTVYVNDRACKIYGYPREEYMRMTTLDFAAPEEHARLQRIVDEIRQTDIIPNEIECWIVCKDGTRRCIRNRYSHIHTGKDVDSRLVVTTDITGPKRAAEALRRRAAQLALLNDVGSKISAVLDLAGVLNRTAGLIQESFGYHHVGLFILERERMELVMRARAGEFADLYPHEHQLKVGQGMVGWVAQSGKRLLANDVSVEPYYVNLYPDVVPTQSELSVPIRVGDEIVGVLDVQSPVLDAFDENDVMVIETLADQIAAVIENARLYDTVQQELVVRKQAEEVLERRAMQLALLNDIGGKISTVLDLESVLERATCLVQESFGYHHVGLFTLDQEQNELVMRAKAGSFVDLYPAGHRLKLNQGVVGWVGQRGESLLANDVTKEPRYVNLYPNVVPTQSELSVPIGIGSEVVGVLDVQSPEVEAFDENDVMVMETLASQIAVAIENARLYEAIQQDVSELEYAKEALRESEARYRAVSELTSDFAYSFRVNQKGVLVPEWVTDAFTRITGFTFDDMETRDDWEAVIHPVDLPAFREHLQVRLSGKTDVAEYRVITKQGEVRWMRDYGRPVWDAAATRITHLYGAVQDTTERTLLGQYMLRTERLTAAGHMAAALSQEIEQPLQVIHSCLEQARDAVCDQDECELYLDSCAQEVEHLSEIADRVLSRAQATRDVPSSVSIQHLVRRALVLVDKPIQRARVEVTADFPPDLPAIQVIPDQIVQVLFNLLLNAVEAVPPGGHVNMSAQVDGDMMILTMTNDGPPIPKEHVQYVFDPFFTTKPEGTGLGLFISSNVIHQHGGTISVRNLEDTQGVAFTATLPLAPASEG